MKRILKINAFLRILAALLLSVIPVQPITAFAAEIQAAQAAPTVSAASAILMCADGRVVFEKNADERRPMASTTKIMTALVAIEHLSLDTVVIVPDEAVGVEGSSMYLQRGEVVTVRDLLYALMLQSANDAAAALAIITAGSVEKFAEMMNAKADELGLESTHFMNPHGLDDPEHYTTARELARITAAALSNETFRAITSTLKYSYMTSVKSGLFVNHNKLLYSLDNCIGGKTGYTKKTGRCLVSATDNDGLIFICVTLSDPDDWDDHRALHSYAMSVTHKNSDLSAGEYEYELPVINGVTRTVKCSNAEGAAFYAFDGDDVRYEVELPRFMYAPVSEGDVCGRVVVYSAGAQVAEAPIVAVSGSENIVYKNLMERIYEFIKGLFE